MYNFLIETDHNIEGHQELSAKIKEAAEIALDRFSDRITRVKVHVSNENGNRSGQSDMLCMMEVRLEGHHPIAVTHHAETLNEAVQGATDKLTGRIESTLDRILDQQRQISDPTQLPDE